ncbi:MAG: HAD family hydrolase [Thermoplasmata archaeon]|nr:HAD family hydrolase [Thermoplasmata archaeon]
MRASHPFHALSLDLGETVWWSTTLQAARQAEARHRTLSAILVGPAERRIEPKEVTDAEREIRVELNLARRGPGTLSTRHQVEGIVRRLDAKLTVPMDEALSRFAFAGLDSDPPTVNLEARLLVQSLNRRGFPVIAISNTQRSGQAWGAYLRSEGLTFEFVITSSDCETAKPDPRLFRMAADRLALTPREVLHIGDRWETDVLGALSVGMGAALYRGLWSRYWNPDDGPPVDPGGHPEVFRWDDLAQSEKLLERGTEGSE